MVTVITFVFESGSKSLPAFTEGMAEHCQEEILYWAREGNMELDGEPTDVSDLKVRYVIATQSKGLQGEQLCRI